MRCGVANTSLVGTFLRCTSSAWVVGEPGMALTMHLVGMFPIHAGITEVGLDSCVVPVATMWGGLCSALWAFSSSLPLEV